MGYISGCGTAIISGLSCAALTGAEGPGFREILLSGLRPDITDADFKVTALVANSTNPENDNTGLANLPVAIPPAIPPAIPAVDSYRRNCAITGPVYQYNRIPNHPGKMPQSFDRPATLESIS